MYLEQKLDEMQEQLRQLSNFMMLMMPDLRKKKDVMHFLKISHPTFSKYLNDGALKKGVHYVEDEDGNLEFIPEQIIAFRAKGMGKRITKSKSQMVDETLSNMGISL